MAKKNAGSEAFLRLLHKVVLENNPKEIAAFLEMAYSTLIDKANPDNDKHFCMRYLPGLLEATGDRRPLDFLAQLLGFVLIKIVAGSSTNRDWLRHIARIAKEAGEAVTTLADAIADGHLSAKDREKCIKEVYEAIEALASLWWALRQEGDDEA